jgi:hypothetical protein
MTRETFRDLEEGAMDALRSYAALIVTPFTVTKRLVAVTVGKALKWF